MRASNLFRPVLLATGAAMALTGCRTLFDPTFMPSGYTYHSEYYKAPPGPPAPDIGYPYDAVANAAAVQELRVVAADALGKLESSTGVTAQPVFLDSLPQQNAFNAAFDYALREEMRARGYAFSTDKTHVLSVVPEISMPEDSRLPVDVNAYNDDKNTLVIPSRRAEPQAFTVKLTASRGKILVGSAEHHAVLPAFGYVRGEGLNRTNRLAPARPVGKARTNAPDRGAQAGGDSAPPTDILAPAASQGVPEDSSAPEKSAAPGDVTREPLE